MVAAENGKLFDKKIDIEIYLFSPTPETGKQHKGPAPVIKTTFSKMPIGNNNQSRVCRKGVDLGLFFLLTRLNHRSYDVAEMAHIKLLYSVKTPKSFFQIVKCFVRIVWRGF